jgi:two-component system OmpR family sensor kinase
MMRRLPVRWLIAAAPAILGLITSLLLQSNVLPNLVFIMRYSVDLAWLVSALGIVVSLIATAVLLGRQWLVRTLAQARAEEQQGAALDRQRFIRRLDHEIKNPLTIIRLGIANLRHSPNLETDQQASLERAEQQVQRLQKLVVDLRWLADLDARTIERTRLDLLEVVEDAIASASPEAGNKRIDVHFQEVPWPVGPIRGDRDLLVTALRNLLDNALKFTEDGGVIEIRASDDGHNVTLEVADTGMGIPADEIDHVFEELYRGQNVARISGSGMGLTLVQRIVSLHGGAVTARSREGRGTVMTIQLPLAP